MSLPRTILRSAHIADLDRLWNLDRSGDPGSSYWLTDRLLESLILIALSLHPPNLANTANAGLISLGLLGSSHRIARYSMANRGDKVMVVNVFESKPATWLSLRFCSFNSCKRFFQK